MGIDEKAEQIYRIKRFLDGIFGIGGSKNVSTTLVSTTTVVPTIPASNETSLDNELTNDEFTVESEAGAIAGLVFGLLIAVGMVVLALVMIKRKRDNNREYQNQLRTQRSTKHNAGVYMDTTTEDLVPAPRIVKGTTAYAALSRKDRDLYEYESDDEI
ncbi:uncharacterized protein LOC134696059 isoform X1 [Mytilus trossulus]|uniref:uncharacterized protein LOC134696059 isoform X1 n=1 Tax=Mytilus trossulus TaxID=6551 RepID=UPI00300461AA